MISKIISFCCIALLSIFISGCGTSNQDKIVLKMTHTQNPGSISDLTAQHFKKLLEEKSNGRITVDIFSNCGLSGGESY